MADQLPPRRWELIHGSAPHAYSHIRPYSVHAAVCSPPYFGLRDYDPTSPWWNQLGQEDQPEDYIDHLVRCLDPLRQLLRPDGCLWVNIGDTYAGSGGPGGDYNEGGLRAGQPRWEGTAAKGRRGAHRPDPRLGHDRLDGGVSGRRGHGAGALDHHKPKDLIGVPWMLAQAMKAAGWWWRSDVIWHKPNPMPEGPKDRLHRSHEYLWLFTPSPETWWDHYPIQEPAKAKLIRRPGDTPLKVRSPRRLRRDVWTIPVSTYKGAHFATFPEELAARCIDASTSAIGVCSTCGAPPRRRTHRDRTTKQLVHDGWDIPECGHPWQPTGALVLDPFAGVATTAIAALRRGRSFVGLEPVAANVTLAAERITQTFPVLAHHGTVTRT